MLLSIGLAECNYLKSNSNRKTSTVIFVSLYGTSVVFYFHDFIANVLPKKAQEFYMPEKDYLRNIYFIKLGNI
jgi:hypothetical protein